VADYHNGMTTVEIATKYGADGDTIRYHLHAAGVELDPRRRTHKPAGAAAEPSARHRRARNPVDLAAFKRDYEAGMPSAELTEKYKLGKNSVSYWAHKAGAKMRIGAVPAARGQRTGRESPAERTAPAPRQKHLAIVKAGPRTVQQARIVETEPDGAGRARCRVAMFEVEGSDDSVRAAVDAVKAALAGKAGNRE
jgi:transposase